MKNVASYEDKHLLNIFSFLANLQESVVVLFETTFVPEMGYFIFAQFGAFQT